MKVLFWAVDCQKDFLNKDGALYVEGAESIKPNLRKLTSMAINYGITVVNTMDFHEIDDEEISDEPDFVNTFPKHCMAHAEGSEFIEETMPESNYHIIYKGIRNKMPRTSRNIIIQKNKFDVFEGNQDTGRVLKALSPDFVVVYGVATNVCVNCAVLGLVKRGYKVVVVKDAIKELPNLPVEPIYAEWEKNGVIFETMQNIENVIKYNYNEKKSDLDGLKNGYPWSGA